MKICIICRKERDSFNEEHVFPADIGGAYVIQNVCKTCNSLVGNSIDTPFCNNKQILSIRHKHKLSRGNRRIKNPIKGKIKREDGKNYVVKRYEDGMKAEIIPEVKVITLAGIPVVQGTIPESMLERTDIIKKMAIDAYKAAGYNYKDEEIAIGEMVATEEFQMTVEIRDSNNPIIFEFVKIAYELAANHIPNYFESDHAKELSQLIFSGKINGSHEPIFGIEKDKRTPLINFINNQRGLVEHQCFAAFLDWEDIGLVCFVRFFHAWYIIKLSDQKFLIDNRIVTIINDCKKQECYVGTLKIPDQFTVQFNWEVLTTKQRSELASPEINFINTFQTNGTIPVYNSKNEIKLKDISLLLQTTDYTGVDQFSFAVVKTIQVNITDELYLKSNRSGELFRLKAISFSF